MGNCQDQFQNKDTVSEQYNNDAQRVQSTLINFQHKKVDPSKYQVDVGYLMQSQKQKYLDKQQMHKTINFTKKQQLNLTKAKSKIFQSQRPELLPLNLAFYHSLGLPQYNYRQIPLKYSQDYKEIQIHQSEDRNGVKYIGQRNKNGSFHGNGVLTSNTAKYIGQFWEGTKHLHGRQIHATQVYEGQFQCDIRKGQGVKYTPSYMDQGQFDKDIISGKRVFSNGNYYIGDFLDGKMHGFGQFYDKENNILNPYVQFQYGEMKAQHNQGRNQSFRMNQNEQIIKKNRSVQSLFQEWN